METALKLKIKHLHTRERVIIVLFKGNNQFLFIQMMKLRPWIYLEFQLNKAETVSSVPQKGVLKHSRGRYIENFLGANPQTPIAKRNPYENIFTARVPRLLTGLPHICSQIQFSCLWACYFLPCQSFILYS